MSKPVQGKDTLWYRVKTLQPCTGWNALHLVSKGSIFKLEKQNMKVQVSLDGIQESQSMV